MRALSFGVQYIDGFVCDESISPRVGFDYEAFPSYENFFARSLWIMQLWEGREDPWVEVLQGFLAGMGYLESDKVTGYFGPLTKQAVCNFQQQAL
jgi:peptidoglycan hydrolase-like protein with peptidoglycan-binding domain